jgi:hypothetical protein
MSSTNCNIHHVDEYNDDDDTDDENIVIIIIIIIIGVVPKTMKKNFETSIHKRCYL